MIRRLMENKERASAVTGSADETMKIGERIGRALADGDIVFLIGELGAGKTTMIKGICKGAEVSSAHKVRSPSFTMILEYSGRVAIRHVDLYRVDNLDDFESIGLFDPAFTGATLIEWANRMPDDPSLSPTLITIDEISENERRITVEAGQTILNSIGF